MKKRILLFLSSIVRFMRGEVSTSLLVKQGMKVGDNFSRQGGVRIDASYCFLVEIGNNVSLAPNVHILTHDASLKKFLGVSRLGRVQIADNVFIGANSIILPDIKIGSNVLVGSGSVVTKDIPENCVYAGNPARFICTIDDLKQKHRELLKSQPFFDRSFSVLEMDKSAKEEMNQSLKNGAGYYMCYNYEQFQK